MRICSRYLLQEMLGLFFLSLLALLSIYLLVDFFSKVDNALENQAGIFPLLLFLLNQIPFIVGKFIPLALLLATMLALGGMAQHNEIVALQAGGIGMARLTAPLAAAGLVLALLTFFINDHVVPVTSLQADYLETVVIKGKKEKNLYNLKSLWYVSKSAIYYFEGLDPEKRTIERALLYNFSEDRRLRRRLDIEKLSYHETEHRWVGELVFIRDFYFRDGFTDFAGFERADNLEIVLSESFADFMVPRKEPDRMSLSELSRYVSKAKNAGLAYMEYTVEIYNRIFYPVSCLLMVLLAVPFSLASRRHGGAARGIAISLGLGFSFWITLSLSLALGQGRLLSPLSAAALPYLVYGLFALFMFRRSLA